MLYSGHTIAHALRVATQFLGTSDARREAEILFAHAFGMTRAGLFAHSDRVLSVDEAESCMQLVTARSHGQPIAYLIGEREFWSLKLRVTSAVLIPRHETELLVEVALDFMRKRKMPCRIADLGTGSGAVALAIAHECPDAELWAADVCPAALAVAEDNASRLGIKNIHWIQSNWFTDFPLGLRFDLIVSNPPYVAEDDAHLVQGDLRFEPTLALTSGGDGLGSIRHISHIAADFLQADGWLLFEHGNGQGNAVRNLLAAEGFKGIKTCQDASGNNRVTYGHRQLG